MTSRSTIRRQFKICLIGDGYVGKTSIRRTYLREGFKKSYIPTLGVDFAQKTLEYEGVPTNLVIWDIAGQPAYAGLRKRYYEGASGIILVYSVVDRTSFDNASKWLVEAHSFMQNLPPLIIAANKIDLSPTHPKDETVSPEEGKEFARAFSEKLNTEVYFIETSALKGINIDEAFYELIKMMVGGKPSVVKEETRVKHPEIATTPSVSTASTTAIQEEASSEVAASSDVEVEEETPPEAHSIPASTSGEATTIGSESTTIPKKPEIDPVTTLAKDSGYLQEDTIAKEMTRLVNLRAELKTAEEDLAIVMSELETKLLNLRNVVHVKKIMYEHLKKELDTTRKEWAEAYNEYLNTDQHRKDELLKKTKNIERIRKSIDEIGRLVRSRVSDLEMKRFSE
jgi:small GTP-binding protein